MNESSSPEMQLSGRVLAGEERENARATVTRPPKRVTVAIIFLERLMARLLLAGNGGLALHLDFAGVIERQLEMVTWWWWWLFFPSSIDEQIICRPAISDLEKQLADQSNRFLNLQEMVDDLASKHAYNPDEDYMEVEAKLRGHLESFLETARSFNTIYTKGIRPWTHMMEVPQLHGFGPAANRLLEAYKMLLKFLGNLRNLRDAHAAVAVGSSETIAGEPSSISRIIISECESALTFLNRDVGILSASIAREQGEEVNL